MPRKPQDLQAQSINDNDTPEVL
ncbi:hypothetical protein AYI69_g7645, partial [Smittium culicis]